MLHELTTMLPAESWALATIILLPTTAILLADATLERGLFGRRDGLGWHMRWLERRKRRMQALLNRRRGSRASSTRGSRAPSSIRAETLHMQHELGVQVGDMAQETPSPVVLESLQAEQSGMEVGSGMEQSNASTTGQNGSPEAPVSRSTATISASEAKTVVNHVKAHTVTINNIVPSSNTAQPSQCATDLALIREQIANLRDEIHAFNVSQPAFEHPAQINPPAQWYPREYPGPGPWAPKEFDQYWSVYSDEGIRPYTQSELAAMTHHDEDGYSHLPDDEKSWYYWQPSNSKLEDIKRWREQIPQGSPTPTSPQRSVTNGEPYDDDYNSFRENIPPWENHEVEDRDGGSYVSGVPNKNSLSDVELYLLHEYLQEKEEEMRLLAMELEERRDPLLRYPWQDTESQRKKMGKVSKCRDKLFPLAEEHNVMPRGGTPATGVYEEGTRETHQFYQRRRLMGFRAPTYWAGYRPDKQKEHEALESGSDVDLITPGFYRLDYDGWPSGAEGEDLNTNGGLISNQPNPVSPLPNNQHEGSADCTPLLNLELHQEGEMPAYEPTSPTIIPESSSERNEPVSNPNSEADVPTLPPYWETSPEWEEPTAAAAPSPSFVPDTPTQPSPLRSPPNTSPASSPSRVYDCQPVLGQTSPMLGPTTTPRAAPSLPAATATTRRSARLRRVRKYDSIE